METTKPDPVRSRAGFLSALAKSYVQAREIVSQDDRTDAARQLLKKLSVQYNAYTSSHDLALAAKQTLNSVPEQEQRLIESHAKYEKQHEDVVGELQDYIIGRSTVKGDLPKSTASMGYHDSLPGKVARSKVSRYNVSVGSLARSERLAEARVQAGVMKKRVEQIRARQLALRAQREFECEMARKQRQLELQQEELQAEATKRRQEMEDALELEESMQQLEELSIELDIRQREAVRSELGSQYDSDEDREDVTERGLQTDGREDEASLGLQVEGERKATANSELQGRSGSARTTGWQDETEQMRQMLDILTEYQHHGMPAVGKNTTDHQEHSCTDLERRRPRKEVDFGRARPTKEVDFGRARPTKEVDFGRILLPVYSKLISIVYVVYINA